MLASLALTVALATSSMSPWTEGRVLDASGQPLAGATVYVLLAHAETVAVRTGAGGGYCVDRIDGLVHVLAAAEDHATAVRLDRASDEYLTLQLRPAATLHGAVVALESGEPVVGAEVIVTPMGRTSDAGVDGSGLVTARGDAAGDWSIAGLAPGGYDVTVGAAGRLRHQEWRVLTPGAERLDAVLAATTSLLVEVSSDDAPAVGAIAQVRHETVYRLPPGFEQVPFSLRCATDEAGDCRFDQLAPGAEVSIRVGQRGSPVAAVDLTLGGPGEERVVRVALVPGNSIAGIVVDERGDPIADAPISLREASAVGMSPASPGRPVLRLAGRRDGALSAILARTDAAGGFLIDALPSGSFEVQVEAFGRSRPVRERLRIDDGDQLEGLRFVIELGEAFAGRVLTVDGEPIADAHVRAETPGAERSASARTAADGSFEMRGISGPRCRLRAVAGGFASTTLDEVATDRPAEVVLERLGAIAGRATLPGGRPAVALSAEIRSGPRSVTVEAGGRYRISEVRPGWVTLTLIAPGHLPETVADIEVAPGATTDGVDVGFRAAAEVGGVVLAADSGAPIAGAEVRVASRGSPLSTSAWAGSAAEVVSRIDGSFVIAGLVPGRYDVHARHPNYAAGVTSEVRVGDHDAATEVWLDRGGGIAGVVLDDDGAPAASAQVHASGGDHLDARSAAADGAGRYSLEHLAAGEYHVRVSGGGVAPEIRRAEVAAGAITALDFGTSGNLVHGQVTLAGEPIADAHLFFVPADPVRVASSVTASSDGDGRYRVRGVVAGDYRVTIRRFRPAETVAVDVVVTGAEREEIDLELARVLVTGVVVAATGEAVADAEVTARLPDASSWEELGGMGPSGRSGADGRFRLALSAAGRYRLRAARDGGEATGARFSRPLDVEVSDAGLDGLVLELEAGLTLRGVVVDADGGPVHRALILVLQANPQATHSDRLGRFELSVPLPAPGLMAFSPAYAPAFVDAPSADHATGLRVVLDRGGTLELLLEAPAEARAVATVELRDGSGTDRFSALLLLAAGTGRLDDQRAETGLLRLSGVPAGEWRARALLDGEVVAEADISVAPEATSRAVLGFE